MNKLKNPLLIVANGDFPNHSIPLKLFNKINSIIACDGAADILINKGYIPDVIIGDIDSLSIKSKEKYKDKIVKVPTQSQNDLRKTINYAKEQNISDILIVGASGKREDHTIGNIFSLLDYKNLNIKLFTDTGFFFCIHNDQTINSFNGQQVSIFSVDSRIKISSNNLKYNFNKESITNIYMGTLNESTSNTFTLKISHGSLLIFQTYNK